MDAMAPGNVAVRSLATSLVEAWNAHDIDRFLQHFSPDYVGIDVNDPEPQDGLDDLRESAARYLEAFPDLHATCDGLLVDGAQVAMLWTARGTHRGAFMHIPATQRQVQIRGIAFLTLEDNTIRHGLYVWDTAGVLRDLGLLPHR